MKFFLNTTRGERKSLTLSDRQYILKMRSSGLGIREIGRKLQRNHSVVSRFLNQIPYSPYLASLNHLEKAWEMNKRSNARRSSSRKKGRLKSHTIRIYVEEKLKQGLSPELIAGRLPLEHKTLSTNYESIYQWIYIERRDLIQYLEVRSKNKNSRRNSRKKLRHRKPATPKTSIESRPKLVDTRERFGDWEGDTIVSRQSKVSIFNLVERQSRYIMLRKIPDCSAESGSNAMIELLSNVPPKLRNTLTLDNGPENSAHKKVDEAVEINTFFCHPYCASERGTVENRNGFIRRFFPKKTDFAEISDQEIERIQNIHNHRPMKCLGFRTPHEVFFEILRECCDA